MSDVIDRIVEKNQKFWQLTTDSTLTEAKRLKLLEQIFPPKAVHPFDNPARHSCGSHLRVVQDGDFVRATCRICNRTVA